MTRLPIRVIVRLEVIEFPDGNARRLHERWRDKLVDAKIPRLHRRLARLRRYNGVMRTAVVVLIGFTPMAETMGGLRWMAPAGWKSEGTTPMRAATDKILPAAGIMMPECVVYFFSAGQGVSVQANIERWNGQFTGPHGKPATAKIAKRTVHGLPVTTIDVTGAYSGMGGPMAVAKAIKPGYRLLGAIIENPGGNCS